MGPTAHLSDDAKKAAGAHYTPYGLAAFLARATLRHFDACSGIIRVLDPACGDGSLLLAIVESATPSARARMHLVGYETDEVALAQARGRLAPAAVQSVDLRQGDFLEAACNHHADDETPSLYDIVISNPPYVRTQVLGETRAQELAKAFGLTGRVDLSHAFVTAMKSVLRDGGILGLLTSNRFMLIQSGAAIRDLLRSDFRLRAVYDLGDTKPFEAAVLPAIVIAKRRRHAELAADCSFVRVYEARDAARNGSVATALEVDGVLEAIEAGADGLVTANGVLYRVERGRLAPPSDAALPWSLLSSRTRRAIEIVHRHRAAIFDDVGRVRVGIKTTADDVFIRDDWASLPTDESPEQALLRPLITHHVAQRWAIPNRLPKRVLYPHDTGEDGKRRAVDLDDYPRARAYLESNRERLESRRYVLDAGRQWYEIWVPQQPADWELPKVVFPDIAERGTLFLDRTGAIVNGDCYWITLRHGRAQEWLLMLLAVGNSSFIQWYYDTLYHNKLYAGRRRFMTQYVKQFPLPSLESPVAEEILRLVRGLIESPKDAMSEASVDALVWRAFGLEHAQVSGPSAFRPPGQTCTL